MSIAAALKSSTTVNNEVSSAKILTLHLESSLRLFMYTRKNRGPTIKPTGTPAEISPQWKQYQFKMVCCFRSLRKLLTRKRNCPEIPRCSSIYRRPSRPLLQSTMNLSTGKPSLIHPASFLSKYTCKSVPDQLTWRAVCVTSSLEPVIVLPTLQ